MASGGLSRQVLADFSAGMYRNAPIDQLPAGASWDLRDVLLDLNGGQSSRGGSVWRSTATFGTSLRWVWDGWLSTGHVTLLASPTAFGRLEGSGAVTNLGEGGLAAPVRPAVLAGKMFLPGGKTYDGTTWGTLAEGAGTADYVTVAANRLLVAHGTRVRFSKIGDPTNWTSTDFHELPTGVQILGLEGTRESCVVFTTRGLWVISGLTNGLTDEAGNVQQRLDHYSGEIVLWGDAGISAWEGSLVVPAADGVWLIRRGVTSEQIASFVRISDPIVDLYRGYVQDGFSPGGAAVFGSHYFLPVIGEGVVKDVLVCRLDMPARRGLPPGAWTHFSGVGADVSCFASRVSSGPAREPELLGSGYVSARALTLEYLNPASVNDADGSQVAWSWQTAAIATGNLIANLVHRIRLRYQLQPAPVEGAPAELPVSVRDNFNRTEEPLSNGGKWTLLTTCFDTGATNGTVWGAAGGHHDGAYYNALLQANPAVSVTVPTAPTGFLMALWACVQAGSRSGYCVLIERVLIEEGEAPTTYQLTLLRSVAGVEREISAGLVTLLPGDKVGISVRGGIVRAWHKPAAGAWAVAAEGRDATYAGGYGGIESFGSNVGKFDDFSVAEVPVGPPVVTSPTIVAAIARDTPPVGTTAWGAFVWGGEAAWASSGSSSYDSLGGAAPVDVSASLPFVWRVRKKRRVVSFRFSTTDRAQRVSVKALEVFVRLAGRM